MENTDLTIGEIVGNNVLVHWKEIKDGALALPDDLKKEKEMQENGIVQIAAIGPDCKIAKVGYWAIVNSGGRVLNYNGYCFGIIKEHQIDVVLKEKPETVNGKMAGSAELSVNGIKLDKTIGKLGNLKDKYGI